MSIMYSWEILHFTEFSITCVLLSLSLFCLETNHELPIKLFGCSIVLHCVLHVGLQYWSIMHSCEISHLEYFILLLCSSLHEKFQLSKLTGVEVMASEANCS